MVSSKLSATVRRRSDLEILGIRKKLIRGEELSDRRGIEQLATLNSRALSKLSTELKKNERLEQSWEVRKRLLALKGIHPEQATKNLDFSARNLFAEQENSDVTFCEEGLRRSKSRRNSRKFSEEGLFNKLRLRGAE